MKSAEERNAEAAEWIRDYLSVPATHGGDHASYRRDTLGRVLAILQPPPKRHVYQGVVFEETGVVRQPKRRDWIKYNDDDDMIGPASGWNDGREFAILKPIDIAEAP